ncbi:glycoside hydrolase family 27 protein [Asticcacaulis solisilvae]|uniref:glycoside hydrolase family 27 protein n=1 Tax=Asticcacaulis solisilvae TaxID=1217274 RepID=UPI003FD7EED9
MLKKVTLSLGAAALALMFASPVLAAGTAPVPPMGWNPWNAFGTGVTEERILAVADTLKKSGLADAGYRYVNMDDGWWLKRRADGRIVVRTSIFPSAATPDGNTSLRPFTDHLHAMGLKAGLYTDIGRNACSQAWGGKTAANLPEGSTAEREIGSYGHQAQDMKLIFGEWRFDYIKVDACGPADFQPAKAFVKDGTYRALGPWIVRGKPNARDNARIENLYASLDAAIAAVRPRRDYVFSICSWGEAGVQAWGYKRGNLWRTSEDINAHWKSMLDNFDSAAGHPETVGPGHWNDPDMLEIGNGDFDADHLTEARAHMSMWAVIAAPLLLGSDVTKWPQSLIDIAGNREVIAIDQDPAGHPGKIVSRAGDTEVVAKPLADGSRAVALINRGSGAVTASVTLKQLGFDGAVTVRDVWAHSDATPVYDGITVSLAAHETKLLRVGKTQ